MKQINLQSGSTLIETMIALFVLAIGVLGVMSMQINAIKYNKSSSLYLQASFLANDLYEGMLLTPDLAESYVIAYETETPNKPECGAGKSCSAEELVNFNLYNWRTNIAQMLPGGLGKIEKIDDQFVIAIEFESSADDDGKSEKIEYELTANI